MYDALSVKYLSRQTNKETEEMNAASEARNKTDSDGSRYGTFVNHATAIKCYNIHMLNVKISSHTKCKLQKK